jgi:sugar fermentation stimulation protein A
MKLDPPLQQGLLLKRYKRFLADIELENGEVITVHCPNTGSMKHCIVPNTPCWFSISDNPTRKLPGTLEITTTSRGFLAGVNTARPNALVKEAIENGTVAELTGYDDIKGEVRYGQENSRIDLLLTKADQQCYVEVKNVTLEDNNGVIRFPDAVTTRGAKHLRELIAMVESGHRSVLLFCVQHSGARIAAPATHIDPDYTRTLVEAVNAGVEVIAYACRLSATELSVSHRIDFHLNL